MYPFRRFLLCLMLLSVFVIVAPLSAELPIEVIYWQSLDVEAPSQDELDSLVEVMKEVQVFFASEMDRYGFREKTFAFNLKITVIEGKRKAFQYTSTLAFANESPLIQEGVDNQIYVLFFGGGSESVAGYTGFSQRLCRVPREQWIYCNNLVGVPTGISDIILPILVHEMAHAFNIVSHASKRLISNKIDVMYSPLWVTPGVKDNLENYAFNRADAAFLDEDGRLSVQVTPDVLVSADIDADVNDDGYVDLYDVLIVRSGMNRPVKYDTDINNDGVTDENDLAIVKIKAMEAIIAASPPKPKFKLATTWAEIKRK